MAKDRVIGFLHDLVGDRKLNQQIFKADRTPAAWVGVAKESGYEFTEEDLKTVAEEIAQKLLPANFVPDLVGALANGNGGSHHESDEEGFVFSREGVARLKAVMQQGRYSGYYRPW
jgi:predicted ribosomally synthesized peptide with nif11-like leader